MTANSLVMHSPVGALRLETDGIALTKVSFLDGATDNESRAQHRAHGLLLETERQLDAYFAGRLQNFDLRLDPPGSQFQQRVWTQLLRIRYASTASYADIAARIGMSAAASRAVGLANGANPIAIVIPCHRVIGADGSLVGYGGGLQRKRFLLDLESPSVQGSLFEV